MEQGNTCFLFLIYNINIMENKVTYLLPGRKKCPVCGSTHIQNISRVTGYLSLVERFGEGKVAEREDRVSHNDEKHVKIYNI